MLALLLALGMARPVPLHVEGNLLLDDAKTVTLAGVDIPGFESTDEGRFVFRSARVAIEDWHANCIELPVCEDRWFGKTALKKDKGEAYVNEVEEVMNLVENRGAYLVLSLSWSDAGTWGGNLGPHDMPDDHSLQFWRDLAVKYRGDPHVLFNLYAAPHGVSWDVWRNGGQVQEGDLRYHTPGMQALLDNIRKAGAKNVCVVSGPDLSLAESGLKDQQGRGIVYAARSDTLNGDWEAKIASICAVAPVLMDGCGPDGGVFGFTETHKLNWLAAAMDATAKPSLIADWVYTPTAWGAKVKQHLESR